MALDRKLYLKNYLKAYESTPKRLAYMHTRKQSAEYKLYHALYRKSPVGKLSCELPRAKATWLQGNENPSVRTEPY